MKFDSIRLDHSIIYQLVEPGSKVLDLGCGEGDLLFLLAKEKDAKVQGIELNEKSIYKCVERGLSVFHGNIDSGLPEYPNESFDYVILNQSLQETKNVELVLREALRVGKKVIVGFPNFAFYKARFDLFFGGIAPVTPSLPYHWYDTPNTHFLSIRDFKGYCSAKNIKIFNSYYLGPKTIVRFLPNLLAVNSIFLIGK